jgi:hypothetical protein
MKNLIREKWYHVKNIFNGKWKIHLEKNNFPFGFSYTRYDGLELYSLGLYIITISVLDWDTYLYDLCLKESKIAFDKRLEIDARLGGTTLESLLKDEDKDQMFQFYFSGFFRSKEE